MQMLDDSKIKAIIKINEGIKNQTITPQMGNFLHRMEQDKSFDRIFLKEGAEESDISTCMQVYQIANNSPEW